jgi:hypothetical protein
MFTLIEYMPGHLRESHLAAGNSGVYPHNGAAREWIQGHLDDSQLDSRWASVVRVAARLPVGETALDEVPDDAIRPGEDDA